MVLYTAHFAIRNNNNLFYRFPKIEAGGGQKVIILLEWPNLSKPFGVWVHCFFTNRRMSWQQHSYNEHRWVLKTFIEHMSTKVDIMTACTTTDDQKWPLLILSYFWGSSESEFTVLCHPWCLSSCPHHVHTKALEYSLFIARIKVVLSREVIKPGME